MRESSSWFGFAFILAVIATVAMLIQNYLPSEPMFVEMTATFLGVFIAIVLGEGIRIYREENKAKWLENKLIEELREILKEAERPGLREMYAATWISIRPADIPARTEPKLRNALAGVFISLEVYNTLIRRFMEYRSTPNADQQRVNDLHYHVTEAKKKLAERARQALELV